MLTSGGSLDLKRAGCPRQPVAFTGRPTTLQAMSKPRMSQPFHYAFFVRDLSSTRRFYGDILGCPEGRSTDTWVDFDFFGNQISAHTTGPVTPTQATGQVEGVQVPMPHFGALLEWDAFSALAERIRGAGIAFVLEPRIRYPGEPGEQATMFLLDPSGNALEFKSFRHREHIFTA
jgi:extradiol dioxygenase family protein